jgi:hypothetical protein
MPGLHLSSQQMCARPSSHPAVHHPLEQQPGTMIDPFANRLECDQAQWNAAQRVEHAEETTNNGGRGRVAIANCGYQDGAEVQ